MWRSLPIEIGKAVLELVLNVDPNEKVSTKFARDVAQPGSALRSGRRGRWFESSHPDS